MAQATLDALDLAILRELQEDGRLANLDLARRIGLSPPATPARVWRLERDGVTGRTVAVVDAEAAGFDLHLLHRRRPAGPPAGPRSSAFAR